MSETVPPLFDAERLRVYPCIFLLAYVLGAAAFVLSAHGMTDGRGVPLGYDFITFYAASKLTLAGDPAAAFDLPRLIAAETSVIPSSTAAFQWGYPPTFQLLVLPLALLPYGLSYGVFVALTGGGFVYALSPIRVAKPYFLPILAAPGVALCVFHGQNTLLSAALFAGGAALFAKRPFWAGVLLGCLAFKPQLGLLIPVALAAAGQWRAFLGAGLSAAAFSALAIAIFGIGLWEAFFAHLSFIETITRAGMLPWEKMPSAFVFCRMLGITESVAVGAQILSALGALYCVALVWRRIGPAPLAWAVLVSATLLLMPYVFDYELALLCLPLAFLAGDMSERGAGMTERAALLFLYVVPFVMAPLAVASHLQLGFPALLLALGLSTWRALAEVEPLRAQAVPGQAPSTRS